MSQYFVRTTGDDSNDGTTEAPLLTIQAAIDLAVGGDEIIIGTGTYQETYGGATWNWGSVFDSEVTLRSESGNATDVIIQATTSTAMEINLATTTSNWTWRNVTFQARSNCPIIIGKAGTMPAITNVKFYSCRFIGGAASTNIINIVTNSANQIQGFNFYSCTFTVTTTTSIVLRILASGGVWHDCTFDGCTINTPEEAILFRGLTNSGFIRGTINSTLNNNAKTLVTFGSLTTSSTACSGGYFSYNTVNTLGTVFSHVVVIGPSHDSVTCEYNTITFGDITYKLNSNGICQYNNITTTICGIELKGAVHCTVTRNTVHVSGATSRALQEVAAENAVLNSNHVITYNVLYADGSGDCIQIPTSADTSGTVCDYNTYLPTGTGKMGDIGASTDLTTLVGLQDAWTTRSYNPAGNDTHSFDVLQLTAVFPMPLLLRGSR